MELTNGVSMGWPARQVSCRLVLMRPVPWEESWGDCDEEFNEPASAKNEGLEGIGRTTPALEVHAWSQRA